MRFCSVIFFLFISAYRTDVHAQNYNIDSLQKSILKNVQQNLYKKGVSKSLFDSSGFLKNIYGGKDLDLVFNQLNKSISVAKSAGDIPALQGNFYKLSKLDSVRGNYKGAYENYRLYTLYRDSLQKKEIETKMLQAKMQSEFDKKQALQKAVQDKKDAEQRRIKNIQYFTIGGLAILLLLIFSFAYIQWKNNQERKKINILLMQQKEKVEAALSELKHTQTQLIQSEKMASLGELTAGIAHEIQNPLNFVNNFSEVNMELIDELKTQKGHLKVEEQDEILNDITANLEKIHHHGKRADSIVKNMLQHSRKNTGNKEPANINALCDEYLRLSYHGLRAKDKSLNADFKTDFDESIGDINMVSQDIGRVLLNLFNNAFYAVSEKQKAAGEKYKPLISVQTKKIKDTVEIRIQDNGNGIPRKSN